jgi:NhaA family Na+:H+ antiporter
VTEPPPTRLHPPVDEANDHLIGEDNAQITLVEYGSFSCPYCFAAHQIIANLRDRFGNRLRYVFRHRPITGNEHALQAAELAEFAFETTGDYWPIHEALMKRGAALRKEDLPAIADEVGLPARDGDKGMTGSAGAEADGRNQADQPAMQRARERVRRHRESAAASGALVSPTFFINGRRYEGAWDESTLAEAMLRSPGHRVQAAALDFARWAPSTGLLLLIMSLLAVALANSRWSGPFEALWLSPFGFFAGSVSFSLPLREWINDGLLTFFFLVVGLEIKREFTTGRLASRRAAILPIAAAVGGMLTPALLYLLIVPPGPFAHGWAIPTTTDTAFAIALIAVLGSRVPVALRIFLTAAVIVDDLVAIVVVAAFYSGSIDLGFLAGAALVAAGMTALNRGGVYRPLPYAVLGACLWALLHAAGVHATLAGVVVAIVTPTRAPANLAALMAQAETVLSGEMRTAQKKVLRHGPSEPTLRALDAIHDRIESPADKLLRTVEPWSSYLVLPLFALANAGVLFSLDVIEGHGRLMLAIATGLVVGKMLGILGGAALAVRLGIADKPDDYSWRQLAGAAALAGIGFTMSLYIAAKAFPEPSDFAAAKIAVFIASFLAACVGTALLGAGARPSFYRAGS